MALRVAFDLDGVLADMDSELDRCAVSLFGEQPEDGSLTGSQQRRLWDHVETVTDFWLGLQELEEGAVRRLAAVADARRWETIFLTTRPPTAGATVQVQSQRWLQSKGFALPSVYVVQGSRGKVAAALDLDTLVDDRLDNCLDVVADSKAKPLLFLRRRSPDEGLPPGVRKVGLDVVQTIDECLDALVTMERAADDRAGIVKRIMRSLGVSDSTK